MYIMMMIAFITFNSSLVPLNSSLVPLIYICIYLHKYIHVYIYICMYICICLYARACVCIKKRCIYIFIAWRTHIYI